MGTRANPAWEPARERFLEPEEVAQLFRRTVKKDRTNKEGKVVAKEGDPDVSWVYNNSLPAQGLRKAGFLFPAARRFNARTLLFDRETLERIIEGANGHGAPQK